jgi:ABC-type branched-subunit amino acid transport system ATPase component
MAIVMDPSILSKYHWIDYVLKALNIKTEHGAIIGAGVLTITVLAIGNLITATNLWIQTHYLALARRELSFELFSGYMYSPYTFHLNRDASSLSRVINGDVESALGGFLASLLGVISKGLSGIVLISLIVIVDPFVAFGAILILGCGYLFVYKLIRKKQVLLGAKMVDASLRVGRTTLEGLHGIKELRVLGRESASINEYKKSFSVLTLTQASNQLAAALPRYVIEVLAFAGIIIVTLTFVLKGEGTSAIPSLALYALAGLRLVPIFQQFFAAAITIKYHTKAVDSLDLDLSYLRAESFSSENNRDEKFTFDKEIKLNDLSFKYPSSDQPTLNKVSLSILRNQSIGLVGRTGSGKTTLVDLILGLFPPTQGLISIDGINLNASNDRNWRKCVGYVPQNVFLTNASITHNIAFGVPEQFIDKSAVFHAAKMAQAEEFINKLPDGYDTIVGERGIKLSGGQRQRLGIARALYHKPSVLVFDEATSALDGLTEDAVMEAIKTLSAERTIILIAHRLRTVQACDRIIMLEAGSIIADGNYDHLLKNSSEFFKLVNGVEK